MTDRLKLARAFLDRTEWADAEVTPLAGDASNRRYDRLRDHASGETAVLMDAPPARGEDIGPFVTIATYLTQLGLSAPHIFVQDRENGFLLIEDLGDALFARVIPDAPDLEQKLYETATDVLIELHRHAPPSGLPVYTPDIMADMASLVFDWYCPALTGPDPAARAANHAAFRAALPRNHDVLIQRDYHAENLLWLPQRDGVARVGLLDFQDAMCGHRAYDLVSLLQDARRDVPAEIETAMIARYVAATAQDRAEFDAAYHLLGAQRNLRILGVFARLCLRDGKAHYVDLIPRVWGYLQTDLAHPALAKIASILRPALPEPGPDALNMLKSKCATLQPR